jgi:uncharacterized FAD-dependent dehydrogenase
MRPYAPVLERMIDLVTANKRMTMGEALSRAEVSCGFGGEIAMPNGVLARPSIPEEIRSAILVAAFKFVARGGFPEAASA